MPETRKPISVVISDESVNQFGFIIRTDGISLDTLQRNPVLMTMHERGLDKVIGKVTNLRKEDGKLLGDLDFDMGDTDAAKIAGKYERGYLHAVSLGGQIVAARWEGEEDAPTLVATEFEAIEVSCVDIPGNRNAVRLYNEHRQPVDFNLVQLSFQSTKQSPPVSMTTKELAVKLGLPETASDAEVSQEIARLKADEAQHTALKNQVKLARETEVKTLLDTAITEGRVQEAERPTFVQLAAASDELFRSTLALRVKPTTTEAPKAPTVPAAPAVNLAGVGGKTETGGVTHSPDLAEEFHKLAGEGKLEAVKLARPEHFKAMYRAAFGVEPNE